MNLTKINGCYSKELREGCNNIKILLKEKSIDVETMRTFVENLIAPASIEAEAKARFRENLKACKTKEDIDELCYLAVMHGMYYTPRRKAA